MMPAEIREITPEQATWTALVEHLHRVTMARHALVDGAAKPETYYLGACIDKQVIGHISIRQQPIIIPASPLTDNVSLPLQHNHQSLAETFVQTFAVEVDHRRQGYGRALQQAALDLTVQLGCYQMRSWSSADKLANYALKLSMGFAVFPALYPMPGGQPISGAYFVKIVYETSESKNATLL